MMMKRLRTLALAAALALTLALPAFAAPQAVTTEIKEALRLINKERESAGLSALKWDSDLAEAAEVRALECTEKFSSDHKRPNGQTFFSVSTKVWGENTAYGFKTAQAAVAGWMKSQGHKENILRNTYTTGAIGCAQADDGTLYWVVLFGNGKSNAGWAGVKSYTFDPFSDSQSKTGSESSATASSDSVSGSTAASASGALLNQDGQVTAAGAEAELKKAISAAGAGEVSVRIKNGASIAPAVLKTLSTTASASGRTVTVQADTMNASGKSVQGRMILEPAKLAGRKTPVNLGVYVDSASVKDIKTIMEQQYSNTMAYIHMEHNGALTVPTKVVAKVKLTGLDTNNLQIHVYDRKKGTLTKLESPNISVDSKGFLTFYTASAGDIVIADKALSK